MPMNHPDPDAYSHAIPAGTPMLNYVLLIVAGAIGMSVLDSDPTAVSLEEWAIYAVMLYAAWKLVEAMIQWIRDNEGGI